MSEKSLAKIPAQELELAPQKLSSLDILDAAVRGGITSENVAVVQQIIAMRREEVKEQAKIEFSKAFFQLKKNMPEIYADKQAMNNGKLMYVYCSEEEISKAIEPVLLAHGFAMLFSQRNEEGRTVAVVTLIHEGGHQEKQEYAVRTGATNSMKDATAADAGATTSAWRHLIMKLFGLKSRLNATDDPRALGGKVTKEQADELERRVAETNTNRATFLKMAGVENFIEIPTLKYEVLDQLLRVKERQGK